MKTALIVLVSMICGIATGYAISAYYHLSGTINIVTGAVPTFIFVVVLLTIFDR